MKMELFPIKTKIIMPDDDIMAVIFDAMKKQNLKFQDNDILVIAETPIGTTEGCTIKLSDIKPSEEAIKLAKKYELLPEIAQLVLDESDEILGGIPHVVLTIKYNTLMANAGVDKSNVPEGYAQILPKNPAKSAEKIRKIVKEKTGKSIGVIIADSRTQPLRVGNIGMALAVAGFVPVEDERGKEDLFGKPLRITRRAVADNLTSAAEVLMGESNESVPAVLIRGAPVTFVDKTFESKDMWMPPDQCMYMNIFEQWHEAYKKQKQGT